jgi:SynChlorMet cassette radical SAM/SPASM protein ScmF
MAKNKKFELDTSGLREGLPALNTIYFYLTEGCNCKCRHCWITPKYETDGGKWPYLSFKLFKKVVEQGLKLGLSSVKLTGGEPLIHPEILDILKYIEDSGLRLVIETNGIACTPEIAAAAKRCSGIFVSVSLDGAVPETHNWVRGVDHAYDGALEGIRNLVEAGIRPQLIMSLVKRNKDQVEALIKLAEELGAGSVKFNLVAPIMSRGEQMAEQDEVLNVREFIEIGKKIEFELQPKTKLKLHYSYPFAFKNLSTIFEKNDRGRCGIFGIVGVLGSGKYALCGIGESVPELVFGEVEKNQLADIWENNRMLNDIREGIPGKLEGVCGDCIMKNMCLGQCVANNYFVHHSLFAPFWFCEEALKLKVFPESRLVPGSKSAGEL